MNNHKRLAGDLLRRFKGDNYIFGLDCTAGLGRLTRGVGHRAAVVTGGVGKPWGQAALDEAIASLLAGGVEILQPVIPGAKPNSPAEDVRSVAEELRRARPDVIVAVGAGSVIDAAKGSAVLATLGDVSDDLETYYGVGKVSEMLDATGRKLVPLVAVELAASSAAHLTKYANITDMAASQKKLIIDDAVVPARALFDYKSTVTMSPDFTADGAMDGLAHCLEVFYGTRGSAMEQVRPISTLGIEMILANIRAVSEDGSNLPAREALGMATDLGGYAIMVGGTSGAHLTSFSLVDVLSHGRACALMNPYYTVFFAPAIEPQLRAVADILRRTGYLAGATDHLHTRDLGLAVADSLRGVAASLGMQTRLADVPGFTDAHIRRALDAARNPQLESKLRNMPVPLTAETVEEFMAPVLEAAKTGEFSRIKSTSVSQTA